MKTFSDEVKKAVFEAQNSYCKNCLNPIDTVNGWHHMLQNTKPHREKYPILINSCINLVGLCLHCHTNKTHKYRIKPETAQVYEKFLQELRDELPF